MTRIFVLLTQWAHRACAVSCRHRSAVGWLAAATPPNLPVPIARAVSLNTAPTYRDAMGHLIIDTDWRQLLEEVANHGIPIELTYGTGDAVGDHNYAHAISRTNSGTTFTLIPGADHHLPMSHPELRLEQITKMHGGDRAGS